MDNSRYLLEKYPNIGCDKCNDTLSVCLEVFCEQQRIFCPSCNEENKQQNQSDDLITNNNQQNETQMVKSLHFGHYQQVYPMGKLLEMNPNSELLIESQQIKESSSSLKQKEIYINLMDEIDQFEKSIANEFKLLRSNINEKYNLISSSYDQEILIKLNSLQQIISKFRQDYSHGFEQKISDLIKSYTHPIKLNSVIFRDKVDLMKEHAINCIKQIQNEIKLEKKVEINDLLEQKWNTSIYDMSLYSDNIAICGKEINIYTHSDQFSKLVKSYELNILETIRFIEYSRDGTLLVTGGNGKLIIFDTTKSMKIVFNQVNSGINAQYYAADISQNNSYLAYSLKDKKKQNNLYLFDIQDLTNPVVKQILNDHTSLILCVKFTNDNQFLITSGCDYKVVIYAYSNETQEYKKVQVLRDSNDIVKELALSNDSNTLVSVTMDGKCYIYTRQLKQQIEQQQEQLKEEEQQDQDNNISNQIKEQKQFEQLNNIKYDSQEKQQQDIKDEMNNDKIQTEQEKAQQLTQELFMKSPSQNPFLAQSLLENKNYLKYYIEKNELERESRLAIEKSKNENEIYEDYQDIFQLTGYFKLVSNKSINSVDIDPSCSYLAVSASEDILIYDIKNKNQPNLLYCIKNTSMAIINKVRFSLTSPLLLFCDQSGQFQGFRYK